MKQQVFKAGDLVRIRKGSTYCGYKSGLVVEVVSVEVESYHDGSRQRVHCKGLGLSQQFRCGLLKLAKQAMLQREALRLVKAGNLPTNRNKSPLANRMRKYCAYSRG